MKTKPHESRDCACAACEKWHQWVEGEEDGWRPNVGADDEVTDFEYGAPVDVYIGPTVTIESAPSPWATLGTPTFYQLPTAEKDFKLGDLIALDMTTGKAVPAAGNPTAVVMGRAVAWDTDKK